jgi:hypothetical protein
MVALNSLLFLWSQSVQTWDAAAAANTFRCMLRRLELLLTPNSVLTVAIQLIDSPKVHWHGQSNRDSRDQYLYRSNYIMTTATANSYARTVVTIVMC